MKMDLKLITLLTFTFVFGEILTTIAGETSTNSIRKENQPVRGSTHRFPEEKLAPVGDAPVYVPPIPLKKRQIEKPNQFQALTTDIKQVDIFIPAGKHFAIQFNAQTKSLNVIEPDWGIPFSENVQAAMNKAPLWMKNDLINVFSLLDVANQEKWAKAILEAQDPYIDEIAFCIAHLSPQYLMSAYASVQLLKENAELIYQHDKVLDYVNVIDYGTSQSDPNYYSTTKYRKAKYLDTLDVEVPRDIYYWYIVHPKITDEIPAYIAPDVIESNYSHNNNITTSENGYFWRNFLFNYVDPGYVKLKDLLKGCKIVWNQFTLPVTTKAHALEMLNRWMDRSMEFTSNDERPHQPVRIYRKHIGRCGENGDLRVAIARSTLIPATNVASYSTDHVWNEFWDERWIHWDGTINDPYMYLGAGWNKKFGSVFQWRSDGSLTSVTDRYTKSHSTLTIYALDSLDQAIDGARVTIYTTGLDDNLWFDNYGTTDTEGRVTFKVGVDRKYYARVSCDYGNVPASAENLLRVVSNSVAGEEYIVSITVPAQKPVLKWEEMAVPQSQDNRYHLEIDFKILANITRGTDPFDDMDKYAYQFLENNGGNINYFMADETNYQDFSAKKTFKGFYSFPQSDSIKIDFELDENSNWYSVFDNSNSMHALQHLIGTAKLYSVNSSDISRVFILPNYPNPLNPKKGGTTITYQLPQKTKVELIIYNLLGQKVKTLLNETRYAGEFAINWDGKNDLGEIVSSGIYWCKIKTAQGETARKMVVVH